ncbi:hypothetical protein HaLaN_29223, partial [Haematococcus lacustris]
MHRVGTACQHELRAGSRAAALLELARRGLHCRHLLAPGVAADGVSRNPSDGLRPYCCQFTMHTPHADIASPRWDGVSHPLTSWLPYPQGGHTVGSTLSIA